MNSPVSNRSLEANILSMNVVVLLLVKGLCPCELLEQKFMRI